MGQRNEFLTPHSFKHLPLRVTLSCPGNTGGKNINFELNRTGIQIFFSASTLNIQLS